MSSPSQRRGGCGHMMAGFDLHSVCACCRDKKKGSDPCIGTPPATCSHCDALTAGAVVNPLLSVPQGTLVCVWETFRLRRLRILFSL